MRGREIRRVKAVGREAEDRFGTNLTHNFERNRKIFWKEVKKVMKRTRGRDESKG